MQNLNYYMHDDPRLPLAWAPWFSHEYITYFSVQAMDRIMTLPQVQVKTNPDFNNKNWPIGPKHVDLYKESYREYRKLSPLWSFAYDERNGEYSVEPLENQTIEPWKILVIYSTEPDLNPDCDLYLHSNQKITGGSHGWRHMQFQALGMKFGMATESVHIHMDLARKAFKSGNDYWGWRYLSRCTHYLADLGNPFHVHAVPLLFLIKNLFSSKKLFRIVSAVHQSYEIYVERRFREGFLAFKTALLQGAGEGNGSGRDVHAEISSYKHQAQKLLKPIFYFFLDEFGQELIDAFSQMDQYSHLDAAAQTNMCSKDAAKVIFQDSHISALNFLDRMTVDILFDVGRMLGILLKGFASRQN
jgi:hypothetical protein